MKNYVNKINSRLSLTIDIWSSSNLLSLLAISGHYICEKWSYKSFVLDLVTLKYTHTDEEIAN